MRFSYKNKTVAITGGGSGIGRAMAEAFAEMGATVGILDRNEAAGQEAVRAITGQQGAAFFYRCDVTNFVEVEAVVKTLHTAAGGIDVLINNAGIGFVGNIEETTEADMDRLYNVNVKGTFNCIKAIIPFFKDQRSGVIVNMASIASSVGISDRFAYSMSKGAVLTMTFSIAKDYLGYNIRCNCISPARIHTSFVDNFIGENYPGREEEMFETLSKSQPIGRMGMPREVADLALYLCSDEASFITGTNFPIDGGFVTINN
jgi:NAD(P)-dependent dehydrogenase (short-subunit alcohol dehydrogenase family)